MRMVDDLTKASASIKVDERRLEAMPDSFFDPQSSAKER